MSFDWKQMQPGDGYFAERRHDVHNYTSELVVGLTIGGNASHVQVLESIFNPTPDQVAAHKRKLMFLEAYASYLNAGGSPAEATRLLETWTSYGGLVFDGWFYFDCGRSEDGHVCHEFRNATSDRFVRWVEQEYIDTDLTAQDILEG